MPPSITIVRSEPSGANYKAKNTCDCKVKFTVETMEFRPRKLVRDSLYVEANDTESFITSYHGHRPTVVSACRDSGRGC